MPEKIRSQKSSDNYSNACVPKTIRFAIFCSLLAVSGLPQETEAVSIFRLSHEPTEQGADISYRSDRDMFQDLARIFREHEKASEDESLSRFKWQHETKLRFILEILETRYQILVEYGNEETNTELGDYQRFIARIKDILGSFSDQSCMSNNELE